MGLTYPSGASAAQLSSHMSYFIRINEISKTIPLLLVSRDLLTSWLYKILKPPLSSHHLVICYWSWATRTRFFFDVRCWQAPAFLFTAIQKNYLENPKSRWWVESQNTGPTFYRLTSISIDVNRPPHYWDSTFFKIWAWKFGVKVMGELNVKSQNMGPTFHRPISLSFHVNRPSQSWDANFFQNSSLKMQVEGKMTMMMYTYRSRQFHITSNGINPSSRFSDMASTKSGPSAAPCDKVWGHGQAHIG